MRFLILAMIAASAATAAVAQDGSTFDNPTPVNFDQPFLYDAVKVNTIINKRASQTEVIVLDGSRRLTPQTTPIEIWLRENPKMTGSGKFQPDLPAPKAPDPKRTPQD